MLNATRIWTMICKDGAWRFRTPPVGPKAGFTSQPFPSRRAALAALRERFNAVPTYYRFEVEREGRKIVRTIEKRTAPATEEPVA